jgi:hypothetical protein
MKKMKLRLLSIIQQQRQQLQQQQQQQLSPRPNEDMLASIKIKQKTCFKVEMDRNKLKDKPTTHQY